MFKTLFFSCKSLALGGLVLSSSLSTLTAADNKFSYELEDVFPKLKFDQPLGIAAAPRDKDRLFIVEKTGRIQVVTGLPGSAPAREVFLDLTKHPEGKLETSSECGVLGLAFHPDHEKNGQFFVYYSLRKEGKLYQRLSRFQVAKGQPNQGDPASEQVLFSQLDPADNHNGGDLHFGPDGFLYVSLGDGGQANDNFKNARYINKDFFAAILRMDVDKKAGSLPPNLHSSIMLNAKKEANYAVPADNPFLKASSHRGETVDPATVRTEIWATGLRNPWRMSFDPVTKRLFAGDVGQGLYEEVDLITRGGDYGWSYREANHPFDGGSGKEQKVPASFKPIDPIFEYPRTEGISVTGGVVYHGNKIPALKDAYIFADYGYGNIWALREKGNKWEPEILTKYGSIGGFGVHPQDGEVIFTIMAEGKIKRLKKV